MAKARLAVRIEKDLLAELEMIATGAGMNESELVREILASYVQRHRKVESCYNRAKKLGIIGKSGTLERDRSTNKGYFDGFGN